MPHLLALHGGGGANDGGMPLPPPQPIPGVPVKELALGQIHLRDPCIVPVPEEGCYVMTGTTGSTVRATMAAVDDGFVAYLSRDLHTWRGPFLLHRHEVPGTTDFWAPEIHRWRGAWYLLGSMVLPGRNRGTYALKAEAPWGPYRAWSQTALTPAADVCLDGTLYVDPAGAPHLIYCHEWIQIGDGGMCVVPLAQDLRQAIGPARTLFHASDAPWSQEVRMQAWVGKVTDGPWPLTQPDGSLALLWSSCSARGYCQAVARAPRLEGPWRHDPQPFDVLDGGHGMVFRTFAGEQVLALHAPNQGPLERPVLLRLAADASSGPTIVGPLFPTAVASAARTGGHPH